MSFDMSDADGAAERSKPLYLRMKQDLVRRISAGEWRPGQLVPSETALAQEYSVSVGTARKAIEELASEHLVVRQRGRGTTIARNDDRYAPFRFYRLHFEDNTSPTYSTLYLSSTNARASAAEARAFNIQRGAAVIRVQRVRVHESRPAVFERHVFREDRCPGGAAVIDEARPSSLYSLLERTFHLIIPRVSEQVQIAMADDEDAEVLGVEAGTPLLEVVRHAFALDGNVVEFRRMRAIPGVHYSNEIGAPGGEQSV